MGCITAGRMVQIMLICLMAMMSTGSASALEDLESIVDNGLTPLSNEESNKLPIKKAYTYVSEYKRLPVFNFGIGKRLSDVNGIKGARPYSFGFGKRSLSPRYPTLLEKVNYYNRRYGNDNEKRAEPAKVDYGLSKSKDQSPDETKNRALVAMAERKRGGKMRPFDFGIGKRSVPSQYETESMTLDREDVDDLRKSLDNDMVQRLLYDLSNRFVADDQDGLQQDY